ncbi:hypothetical protein QSH57_004821 [Fusarium oxysporum f. sp. vasinfectum]|nr:hypothetical protein QSH57_004821 [Fusarium oxysporum f. sp. vasinfectum]
MKLMRCWITDEEANKIHLQFQKSCVANRQVLWSGMLRQKAQYWADKHDFQTLTTALGPLLNPADPQCPNGTKSSAARNRYIHGASILFAWFITYGDLVTVLSQPPPQRFHPSGQSFYQLYEEPIIKGKMDNQAVKKIVIAHPTVGAAVDFTYEMWPHDEPSLWTTTFGIPDIKVYWRQVKTAKPNHRSYDSEVGCQETGEALSHQLNNEKRAQLPPKVTQVATSIAARKSPGPTQTTKKKKKKMNTREKAGTMKKRDEEDIALDPLKGKPPVGLAAVAHSTGAIGQKNSAESEKKKRKKLRRKQRKKELERGTLRPRQQASNG